MNSIDDHCLHSNNSLPCSRPFVGPNSFSIQWQPVRPGSALTRRKQMNIRARLSCLPAASLCLPFVILPFLFHSQTALAQTQQSNFGLEEARMVLKVVKEDVSRNYYDPKFRGNDLDAKFKAAEEKLKGAQSAGQMMGIIAQTLLDFDDSHLFF